ncbi:amidase [Ranunculus cassubicifolius]
MKGDITKVVDEFQFEGFLDWRLNHTFIRLIPKVECVENVGDFRPISLLSSVYKILSKVLASRLKGVIGGVISQNQSAFVKGRQITDCCLVANELIDSRRKEGLRQGDPLSPLFIMVTEVLSMVTSLLEAQGELDGFKVSNAEGGVSVSHLQFADDTMFFLSASEEKARVLRGVLLWFEVASGLKINMAKSKVYSVGASEGVINEVASILGCGVEEFPSTYLGLPLGAKSRSINIWGKVIERVEKRLGRWKTKYLTKGGRLTLLKATLSQIPIYFLSLFPIPKSVLSLLEAMFRSFLWGDSEEKKKIHWVRWERLSLPKEMGGLDVKD